MLKFGNKEFRNLQEQVEKNMTDIQDLLRGQAVLDEFGIKVVGQIDTAEELPETGGEFGDAYAVGTETPYELYIWTRNVDMTEPGWFNIGRFPVAGPEGQPGPQGNMGPEGPKGEQGVEGVGIANITDAGYRHDDLTGYTEQTVLVDLSDGTSRTFTVHAKDGKDGGQLSTLPPFTWDQYGRLTLQYDHNTLEVNNIDGLKVIGGGSGGAVDSVNGKTGDVVLSAADIKAANAATIQSNLERIDSEINRVEDEIPDVSGLATKQELNTESETRIYEHGELQSQINEKASEQYVVNKIAEAGAHKQDKLDSYSDHASVNGDVLTINYKVRQEDGSYNDVPVEFAGGGGGGATLDEIVEYYGGKHKPTEILQAIQWTNVNGATGNPEFRYNVPVLSGNNIVSVRFLTAINSSRVCYLPNETYVQSLISGGYRIVPGSQEAFDHNSDVLEAYEYKFLDPIPMESGNCILFKRGLGFQGSWTIARVFAKDNLGNEWELTPDMIKLDKIKNFDQTEPNVITIGYDEPVLESYALKTNVPQVSGEVSTEGNWTSLTINNVTANIPQGGGGGGGIGYVHKLMIAVPTSGTDAIFQYDYYSNDSTDMSATYITLAAIVSNLEFLFVEADGISTGTGVQPTISRIGVSDRGTNLYLRPTHGLYIANMTVNTSGNISCTTTASPYTKCGVYDKVIALK